jgi:hypothetical protein
LPRKDKSSRRAVSRGWCFSSFRDRMIFFGSMVKLMVFAEAPSVLAHEGRDRIRLGQRG